MGGDWQQLIQSVIIGLIFSFLLAKLISIITAFKDDNLFLTRASVESDPIESDDSVPGSLEPELGVNSDLGIPKMGSFEGLGDLGEVGSRVSDDNCSVVAEQGSVAGLDSVLGDEDDENDGVDDDDDDDDWEGVESTELDEAFSAATAFVAATAADRVGPKLSNELQLQLYGLFKIATEGPCTAPMPPAFKMAPRAKWQAWQKLGVMPPEDAMQKYVDIVTDFPSWAGGATKVIPAFVLYLLAWLWIWSMDSFSFYIFQNSGNRKVQLEILMFKLRNLRDRWDLSLAAMFMRRDLLLT